jgi:type I restriction enzyme S subunit
MIKPSLDLMLNLTLNNELLRRTRDLLLPKLISGEVDVSELVITVPEEAA